MRIGIRSRWVRVLTGTLLGFGWLAMTAAAEEDEPRSEDLAELLQSAQSSRVGLAWTETPRYALDRDGYLRSLGTPPGVSFPVTDPVPGDPVATALSFMKEHSVLFGVTSESVDFEIVRSKPGADRTYVRLQQQFLGLPVFGAEVMIQVNDQAGVEFVNSDITRGARIPREGEFSTAPAILPAEAGPILRRELKLSGPISLTISEPALHLFDPAVLGSGGGLRLVWVFDALTPGADLINHQILLDAHSGEVVRRYPYEKHARNRRIWDANNTTNDPGTLEREEGNTASTVADVNDAYDFLGDTYDFYSTHHGRDAMNDAGMEIRATVRACRPGETCPWDNASWNGTAGRIYVGDGWAVDDVMAHEYTHAVTSFESGLIYENHSGAINESFSDVWGEFVDLENGAGWDSAAVRWEVAEDLTIGSIRGMADPPLWGDPDRLNSPLFILPVSDPQPWNDYGGVHTNSGVNNKLGYLLTDGDGFRGQNISGMGINLVADLYYEVQTNVLTSGGDYHDLYHALMQAAANLGWTTAQRNNVYRGCVAVEITEPGSTIYVDAAHSGVEDGSAQNPFNTITEALNVFESGDHLIIRAGLYPEAVTFDEVMGLVEVVNGSATIGP